MDATVKKIIRKLKGVLTVTILCVFLLMFEYLL